MPDLVKLSRLINISTDNEDLYREALTHTTFAEEHQLKYNNERLEFLGDAVVQIILTDYLFKRYPDLHEGDLSKIRSAMANQKALSMCARQISLAGFLALGRGEAEQGGENRDSTLCDAFEALTGAIYLDHGLETARGFVLGILEQLFPEPKELLVCTNPKGVLQEYTQTAFDCVPTYQVLKISGPDHAPSFEVAVSVRDEVLAVATAGSRKLAEQEAARLALDKYKL